MFPVILAFSSNLFLLKSYSAAPEIANNDSPEKQLDYSSYMRIYSQTPDSADELLIPAVSYDTQTEAELIESSDSEKGEYIKWANGSGSVSWKFTVPDTAFYNIKICYMPLEGSERPIEISILVDQSLPYGELEKIRLFRFWENKGTIRENKRGDQIPPVQQEVFEWTEQRLFDADGFYNEPLKLRLEAGEHTIALKALNEPFAISCIRLTRPEDIPTYNTQIARWKSEGAAPYTGEAILVEGEDAVIKTSKSLVPKSDPTDSSLSPANPEANVLNYIGTNNWKEIGETLTWKVKIPQDGLYQLSFHYRQNYLLNGSSYRCLRIDGEAPFLEASEIEFKYNTKWDEMVFGAGKNDPYLFYLTSGEHLISLSVTMGPIAEINAELENVVSRLGETYRKIVMITGETPDINRDYDLFGQISGLEDTLTDCRDTLNRLYQDLNRLIGKRSSSNSVVLKNMANVLNRMLTHYHQATDFKNDYYNNYCSLGAVLYEMRKLPIDLDAMVLSAPGQVPEHFKTTLIQKFVFGFKRLLNSFNMDYKNINGSPDEEETPLNLWINWGRDQARVLNNLIETQFTQQYGIRVNVKITNASPIQAILSGNDLDIYLRLERSQPVNLAMRGALYDLSLFPDYNEIITRFHPSSTVPYIYQGGTYALPDTQVFYMQFYRKDILAQFGLKVPETWDEFKDAVMILGKNNMLVGLPYVQISDMSQINIGVGALNLYATILLQNGESVYNDELSSTNLASQKAIKAFDFWTRFYTQYKVPVTYDFYNRFRTGQMPLAIVQYTQYTTLSVAAPEISGLWGMAPIPGFVREDDHIDNTVAGGGTGSVILNQAGNKENAWTFLKWWTQTETQVSYSTEIESVLGPAERQASANIEALKSLSWGKSDVESLQKQWEMIKEIPEVPGGYYTSRVIDQSFWEVVNKQANPRDVLVKWGRSADYEIRRKRNEYKLD